MALPTSEQNAITALVRSYETAVVIAYTRPFAQSRGEALPLSMKMANLKLSDEKRRLHDRLVEMRNKICAYSDSEMMSMPSSSKALMGAAKKRAEKLQAKGNEVDFKELLRMEPDSGTTNIRNVKSKHWNRWLGVENRCVVPFNSFSEFNKAEGGDIWFALDEHRPFACFAGMWANWTSVRKVKEGETTNDLYAFLTTEPNAKVGAIHPKAMPVILTTPEEVETWLTAPLDEALRLQRPLPDGALRIVARGVKEDPAPAT